MLGREARERSEHDDRKGSLRTSSAYGVPCLSLQQPSLQLSGVGSSYELPPLLNRDYKYYKLGAALTTLGREKRCEYLRTFAALTKLFCALRRFDLRCPQRGSMRLVDIVEVTDLSSVPLTPQVMKLLKVTTAICSHLPPNPCVV